jgi:tetratricopeptide (TPR) repeat protein
MTPLPVLAAVLAAAALPCRPSPRQSEDVSWLRKNCRVLTRADDPKVERAHAVLEQLVELKDLPRFDLLLIDGLDGPQAYVTRTREIVLSKVALELCYAKFSPDEAEANVAFILAHELAHWSHKDPLLAVLADDEAVFEFAVRGHEERETKADATAVVDIMRAGFDPAVVQRSTLLRRWASDDGRAIKGWYVTRKRGLSRLATRVKDNLPLFEAGAAFVMAGLYDDAAALLDAFLRATDYDGREVLSNIGFARLQPAFRILAGCDRSDALRFALPGAIDTQTRVSNLRLRGADSPSSCRDDAHFRELLARIRGDLDKTVRTDADYAPAHLNLVAALLLERRFTEALSHAESVRSRLKLTDVQRLALDVGLAVAKYGTGEQMNNAEFRRQALDDLRRLAEQAPHDVAAAYNLARMLSELADPADPASRAEATRAWERVRTLNPPRPLAEEARRMLKPPDAPEDDNAESADEDDDGATAACLAAVDVPLPFPLGLVDRKKNPTLPKPNGKPIDFGLGKLYVYEGPPAGKRDAAKPAPWRAYAIETEFLPAAVQLVVQDLAQPVAASTLRERLGAPEAEVALADGRRVLRYKACAWVVEGEQAVQRLAFQ